jgi:hypothetical protein
MNLQNAMPSGFYTKILVNARKQSILFRVTSIYSTTRIPKLSFLSPEFFMRLTRPPK